MKTYWCRWEVPDSVPEDHMVETWPKGMKGWITGSTGSTTIWCARVDAETAEHAETIIRKCYGKSGKKITMSFAEEKELGWRPKSDRFPDDKPGRSPE